MMCSNVAQTIIESHETLNSFVQSTTTTLPGSWAGLMEAARAVKMRWQNVRQQNKFDDVSTTVEIGEKERVLDTFAGFHFLTEKLTPSGYASAW